MSAAFPSRTASNNTKGFTPRASNTAGGTASGAKKASKPTTHYMKVVLQDDEGNFQRVNKNGKDVIATEIVQNAFLRENDLGITLQVTEGGLAAGTYYISAKKAQA